MGCREIIDEVKTILFEFRTFVQVSPLPCTLSPIQWCPPQVGNFKVNFDAAMFSDLNYVGIGTIIRDHNGDFFAGLSKQCYNMPSIAIVKLKAGLEAITFAVDVRWISQVGSRR